MREAAIEYRDGFHHHTPNTGARPPWLDAGTISGSDRRADVRCVIEHTVMSVFGVAREDLLVSNRGVARVALARQTAMYLAHTVGQFSLTEVGLMFERDRTTVAHACAVVEDRRDDPNFDRAVELLERAIARLIMRSPTPRTDFDA